MKLLTEISLELAKVEVAKYDKKYPNAVLFPYWMSIEEDMNNNRKLYIDDNSIYIYEADQLISQYKYTFS